MGDVVGESPALRAVLKKVRPPKQDASAFDVLVREVRRQRPKADLKLIERAYQMAEAAHDGQVRKSGDLFISHPLAVATIVAELGLDETTVAAALLHDAVEDTELLVLSKDSFARLLAANPKLEEHIHRTLEMRRHDAEGKYRTTAPTA